MKPVIGVTPSPIVDTGASGTFEKYALSTTYVNAVISAGGIPIVLPPQDGAVETLLPLVDGLLFSGGADVEPARYGDPDIHPATYDVHPLRDRFEFELMAAAFARDIPVLCICRGIQLLNVACGGTLFQHVPEQVPAALPHRQQEMGFASFQPSHDVIVQPGTLLAEVFGTDRIPVNSYHHQAVRSLAPPLRVAGYAGDGLIEAVDLPGRAFVLGVQWHPEMMFHEHPAQLRPFQALVVKAAAAKLAGIAH
jgi:putative glutamine amidotransferase